MTQITVTLLGSFNVMVEGQAVTGFATDKVRALLTFLAVESGRPHRREVLAGLLWPEIADPLALSNLRQTIHRLRETLLKAVASQPLAAGDDLLLITRQTIQLNQRQWVVDVTEFEALLLACTTHDHTALADCDACLARLTQMATLYQGELLAGFGLWDAPAFEEWLLLRRERLHHQALLALNHLALAHEARGELEEAHPYALRQLALDPYREETQRQVLRLLAQRGLTQQALAQYEVYRRLLRDEVGVEPNVETVTLVEQIRSGKLDKETRRQEDRETGRQGDRETRRGGDKKTKEQRVSPSSCLPVSLSPPLPLPLSSPLPSPLHDLAEMPVIQHFHGRGTELAQLEQWLIPAPHPTPHPAARLVAVLGMGGMGKTALVAQLVKRVADRFTVVLWHSLLNAPPLTELLTSWLQILSRQTLTTLPSSPEEQLRLLLNYLRQERCLLVLDNMESILLSGASTGHPTGQARPGYEGYLHLLQRVGATEHQSCLLLTSRERPRGTARLAQTTQAVRILSLSGLDEEAGQALMAAQGLSGTQTETQSLLAHYSGHPLALQIVAATIKELFGGDVAAFQRDGVVVFDTIGTVLDEHFARLTELELEILIWLAIEREAISAPVLRDNLVEKHPQSTFLEALRSLQRRSLLVQQGAGFTLQNVVIEYLTEYLVESVYAELLHDDRVAQRAPRWGGEGVRVPLDHPVTLSPPSPHPPTPPHPVTFSFLNRYSLLKAQVKEYVRQSQARLILQPIAERLLAKLGRDGLLAHIQALLSRLRTEAPLAPGYAGGNLLNLLLHLRIDPSGYDFSRLSVWQADLRGVTVADLNFGEADLAHSAFTLDFNIFAMMFDQTGQVLIAAPSHGGICLWRVAKGQLHDAFRTPSQGGAPLVFSPDGQLLAGCCLDHSIRLWSVETGVTLHILHGHTELANALAFSPATQQVASSSDNTIRLWDVSSGRCLRVLQHESSGHVPLAYRPAQQGNPLLASGGRDEMIYLWDTEQGQVIDRLRGHRREIESLAFSPDGALLASGGHDGMILLWDVRVPGQSQLLGMFQGHSQVIRTLVFHPTGHLLASGSADYTIRLWDVNSRQTRQILLGHANEVALLAFNADGSVLASSSADRVVRLWDTQTGHALDVLNGYIDAIHAVCFSPDGGQLASGSADGLIRLWERSNQRIQDRPTRHWQGHAGQVLALAFSPTSKGQRAPDASLLASGSTDTTVQLWDLTTGKTIRTLRGHSGPVKSLAFRRDGQLLASGSADRTIRLWPMPGSAGVVAEQSGRVLRGHTDDVVTVAFSPDGSLLVSSSFDHTARLWAVESGQAIALLQGHTAALCAAAFSPTGDQVATISYDNTVCLWEVATGRRREGWEGISAGGRMVAFSPQGDRLIHSSEEVDLMIRDVRSGSVLHTLRGHSSTIIALDFSPTEPILASSGWDGTIRLWDLETGACLQTLRAPGPYAGMNILGVTGITEAQKAALRTLGAVEDAGRGQAHPLNVRSMSSATLAASPAPRKSPPHNVPTPLTPLVGRERELAEIRVRLHDPAVRLLTLIGVGGMGKTRLALAVAQSIVDSSTASNDPQFPDGIFFVALAPLTDPATLAPTIATAIDLNVQGSDPSQALCQALRAQRLLLILDNFEHLLPTALDVSATRAADRQGELSAAVELVADLLRAVPGLRVLATSRQRLNLRGEHLYPVEGMGLAQAPTLADAASASAVRLFVQSVQRSQPHFTLHAANLAAVLRICSLVQGMPLALELAAAWADQLTLSAIADEITKSADFLTGEWYDVPERQRSMRAVFDWSWRLLDATEQQVLRQLAVFRGGFTRDAAAAITGASLRVLTSLVHKSLLHWQEADEGNGRYALHELLRQFAGEPLEAVAGEQAEGARRHSEFYLAFVAARAGRLARHEPREAATEIQSELDNVRQAWAWAVRQARYTTLDASAYAMWQFYVLSGFYAEGAHAFRRAADCLATRLSVAQLTVAQSDAAGQQHPHQVWSKLLAIAAHMLVAQGSYDEALALAQQAVGLGEHWAGVEGEALGLLVCAQTFFYRGQVTQARAYSEQSLQRAHHHQPSHAPIELLYDVEFTALLFWGGLAKYADNYAEARSYFAQSLQICQRLNKVRGQFHSRFNQAGVARTVYDLVAARKEYEQMLHLARKLNYRWGEAAVQFELGDVVRLQGEYTFALDLLGRGLRIFREVNDPLRQACVVATLTCLYSYLGATPLAQGWAEQFLDLTRAHELPDAEEYGLPMLAAWAYHKGDHEQALHYATRGLEKARAGGTLSWQARLLVIAGHAEVGLGRMADATDAYQQAVQIYQTIGVIPPAAEAGAGLAHIALMQGDLAGAQTLVATILPILAEHPRAGVDEPFLVYLTCYRVLAASDDPRAVLLLQRGYDLLHQYAHQIEDEALRRAFLENVATHRQLREEWERTQPVLGRETGRYAQRHSL